MICSVCRHENPERAKFCFACGAALALPCASCGTELPPAAKFCLECGTKVGTSAAGSPSAPPEAGARKVVSILFADLVGSTALHERLDAESARAFMERYYAAMRGAVDAHGGTVAKLLGDGVMVVFGLPRVAEDDAIRAVRAAVAMQQAFRALADEQGGSVGTTGLRVAVNTGEVVAQDARELLGDPVNVAARLQEQGGDGDVVIGEATRRLVASLVTLAPLGSVTLKGRAEAVAVYRVVSLDPPAGAAATPFVGRGEELARLTVVYDAAVATPATRLAVLMGSPGLGKSRLIAELVRRFGDSATVLTARCDAAGGATFAPLAGALLTYLQLDDGAGGDALEAALDAALPAPPPVTLHGKLSGHDGDRARIVAGVTALLTGTPGSPEETFFVVRRFLAGLAAVRPVVLIIDDLHWAEPLLLDLVEHLVQWGSGVPIFVLAGARVELRAARASLAARGPLVTDVVTLAGLDAGAAMRLAANVIGAADLPAAVAAKVLATSEGNPLFVGELVRMLVHEGALQREGERWIVGAGLAALEMPPTIHALLAARIERLSLDERAVLERAAVIGRSFSRGAVAELLGPNGADLDIRLEALRRGDLIERDNGWYLGEPAWRFHHVLIRDAAYRRILKGTRAELHARVADWITARAGAAVEHEETVGRHLEQAHQHLRELGPLDAKGKALGERASHHLAAAGRRALARDDLSLASGLFGRALAGLEPSDERRAELALDWCEALLAGGDVGPAGVALVELGRFSDGSERLRAWHTCFTGQRIALTAPEALNATVDAVAAAAEHLTMLGDAAGEAKAHQVHAQALARLGRVGAAEAALDRALAAARRAGDRRRANAVLAGAPLAALWGPSPVTRASGRCLDVVRVLRITQGAPAVEAVALSCQGVLEALRGRSEAARRMVGSARQMVEELGIAHRLYEADVFGGRIELLEGDPAAAERVLRPAYDGLRDLGLRIDAARAGALLARALLAQDRAAEAERLSHESELLAGDDLQAAIAWRGARAEALARRGDHAPAIELAQAAVAIAAATDALLDHADARLVLAGALRAAGRRNEADAEERRAAELWKAKGATLLAERAIVGYALCDADRDAEALAPFQESVGASARAPAEPFANAASRALREFQRCWQARDWTGVCATYDPAHRMDDRRRLMRLEVAGDAFFTNERMLFDDTASAWHGELLATRGDRLALFRVHFTATVGASGPMEVEALDLVEVDAAGKRTALVVFDPEDQPGAYAEIDARWAAGEGARSGAASLLAGVAALQRCDWANAATMAMARYERTWAAHDWEGSIGVYLPTFQLDDRRPLMRIQITGESFFTQLRTLFDLPRSRFHFAPLATRGDCLALGRVVFEADVDESGGPADVEFLEVFAVDEAGRHAASMIFDPADADAAYAELDARYEAGEGAAHPAAAFRRARTRAVEQRDWDAFAATCAPDLLVEDHRRLGFGTVRGPAEFVRMQRSLFDLAPDTTFRFEHERRCARGVLHCGTLWGTRDGGAFETPLIGVTEFDADGRQVRYDIYDVDRPDEAWQRFEAIAISDRQK